MKGSTGSDFSSALPSKPEIRIKEASSPGKVEMCGGCGEVREVAAKRKIGGSWISLCRLCELAFLRRELKTCEGCGALISTVDFFCGKCGASLQARCKECGAALSPEDIFCGVCGERR